MPIQSGDSLTIIPGSFRINGQADTLGLIRYNNTDNTFIIAPIDSTSDSLLLCYRVFPFRLDKTHYKRDIALYDSNAFFKDEQGYKHVPELREQLFSSEGLNKNGSISRGISFGNNQSVFVNSALNLQLEGKLSENINITAVISDQNVPFQPEGNTQQLQEFDKVYIQLSNQKNSLTAGDIVLQNKPSAFLKYYKNVQGGMLTSNYEPFSKSKAETSVSAAVAKGKFYSSQLPVLEGVQGPYRLRGPNNESFIIILANSERVYLDGRLLQRGFNHDYVIDYNQAEITFNSTVVVTKFSRVRVDFEYAERNYGRTIFNASHYQIYNKLKVSFNHYQEADNPNNPLGMDLDTNARRLLSDVGDNLAKAVISSEQLVEYNETQVLYIKKDTILENGNPEEIFVYTPQPSGKMYQVVFSDMGSGNGAYIQEGSNAAGRVYRWVGTRQGRYLPVRVLPAPNKRRMTTFGAAYEVTPVSEIYTELALSEMDLNRFSDLDAGDDKGGAFKVGYSNKGTAISFLKNYKLIGNADYEYLGRYFNSIDRFRDIEFERNWSASAGDTLKAEDHLITASLGAVKDVENKLVYQLNIRNKEGFVNGAQHRLEANKSFGKIQVNSAAFLLRNNSLSFLSEWERLQMDVSYKTPWIVPGYVYSIDKNKNLAVGSDSIISSAMNFTEHKFYIRNNDTSATVYQIDYSLRNDHVPVEGDLVRASTAQTMNATMSTRIGKGNDVAFNFTYRNLENHQKEQLRKNEETIMGRLDWNLDLFQRHIRSELNFASATGRELKRDFQFLLAPPGQGTHVYIGDSLMESKKDINNYVPLNPSYPVNNTYYKVFLPTNDYIIAYTNNLNYRLNITAPRAWMQYKNWKGFLARFSNVSSWTTDKKITSQDFVNRFVPFSYVEEEELLSTQDALRSSLFFNRSNPRYGVDLNYINSRQKQLLTNGFESRTNVELRLNSRVNLRKTFNLQFMALQSTKATSSDFLSSRNYSINTFKTQPELAYQPRDNFRLTAMVSYADKKNIKAIENAEKAIFNEVGLEARWTKVTSRAINANLKYIKVDFKGQENTPLGYEMLEALRPGGNITWALNWQQKLANGLQISFNYEGRKSEKQLPVHIGRMQVSALF